MTEPLKNTEIPFVVSVTDMPIKVTLYPTGHLVVAIDEYLTAFGYAEVPESLGKEIKQYLGDKFRGELIKESHCREISAQCECICRAWFLKQETKK